MRAVSLYYLGFGFLSHSLPPSSGVLCISRSIRDGFFTNTRLVPFTISHTKSKTSPGGRFDARFCSLLLRNITRKCILPIRFFRWCTYACTRWRGKGTYFCLAHKKFQYTLKKFTMMRVSIKMGEKEIYLKEKIKAKQNKRYFMLKAMYIMYKW